MHSDKSGGQTKRGFGLGDKLQVSRPQQHNVKFGRSAIYISTSPYRGCSWDTVSCSRVNGRILINICIVLSYFNEPDTYPILCVHIIIYKAIRKL